MNIVTLSATHTISYEVLKDYHVTAQAIYDTRLKQKQSLEVEFDYEIIVPAETKEGGEAVFIAYLKKLRDLGIYLHTGHLIYITQNILKFEGNYINDEAVSNDFVIGELEVLKQLLEIQAIGDYSNLKLDLNTRSKAPNHSELPIKIVNSSVIKSAVSAIIQNQFEYIKGNEHAYSLEFNEELITIDKPSLETTTTLIELAKRVKPKPFATQLLYTVCTTLLSYLNKWTTLNPDQVALSNDQAKVIYYTCKLHNLINLDHHIDKEITDYIRSVLNNNRGQHTMLASIVED